MKHKLPHDHGNLTDGFMSRLPRGGTFDAVSELFWLMSDPKRLEIFWILCHCEECVINISSLISMSSPAVSHHLKLLKSGGLVISRREGKEVYYTTAKTPRTEVLHSMIEQIIDVECPIIDAFAESSSYDSSVGTVNEVHTLITGDIKRRYTVEELSERFHVNTTTLKGEFKRVFGLPIATYMKEYRVKRAMELLRGNELSIAEVAFEVGYENPGKFAQAFRDVTGVLPKDYRKALKKELSH